MKNSKYKIVVTFCFLINSSFFLFSQEIDRKLVVQRHNILLSKIDSLSSLSVGNGNFAFTVDATGMQSFPDAYANGVPLGTQSVWGWHSFPNTEKLKIEEAQKTFELEWHPLGSSQVQYLTRISPKLSFQSVLSRPVSDPLFLHSA